MAALPFGGPSVDLGRGRMQQTAIRETKLGRATYRGGPGPCCPSLAPLRSRIAARGGSAGYPRSYESRRVIDRRPLLSRRLENDEVVVGEREARRGGGELHLGGGAGAVGVATLQAGRCSARGPTVKTRGLSDVTAGHWSANVVESPNARGTYQM